MVLPPLQPILVLTVAVVGDGREILNVHARPFESRRDFLELARGEGLGAALHDEGVSVVGVAGASGSLLPARVEHGVTTTKLCAFKLELIELATRNILIAMYHMLLNIQINKQNTRNILSTSTEAYTCLTTQQNDKPLYSQNTTIS